MGHWMPIPMQPEVSGGQKVPIGDEETIKSAVYLTPVLAEVDATRSSFKLYQDGIYSDPQCPNSSVNYPLQVVGYGSLNGMDYWICRNNWGVN
ncbi:cathepsin S-like [Dreissena polymorpha]|uniref:cathepsin S-like n=1 Tax=Dreissena polymorpha TaxID=45954 RepID=UPI002265450D|nr:cathepsin S-like [Dreissena polymorpha]